MTQEHPDAVLLCGAYGTGKSSVAAEMAELLEARDVPYAAIDLDWLAWFNAMDGSLDHEVGPVELKNLSDVVRNYLDAACCCSSWPAPFRTRGRQRC